MRYGVSNTIIARYARKLFTSSLLNLAAAVIKRNNRMTARVVKTVYTLCKELEEHHRAKSKRRFWIGPLLRTRQQDGEFHTLVKDLREKDPQKFCVYFRMTPRRFDELLSQIAPLLQKRTTKFRKPISPEEQLAMTLRYLAHGDSQRMIAISYRVGQSTICNIIRRTCKAIWDALRMQVLPEPTTEDWQRVADDFQNQWQYPNCVGAIDGKHVVMQCPANAGSEYYNYKGTHSIVLMAACDANYKFTWVDIGASGRDSDGGVFGYTHFGKHLVEHSLNLPQPSVLPCTDIKLPYVFVADEAFPLTPNIMRPYPGRAKDALSFNQTIFNYRLSRARRVVENAFGILATRWRIYRRSIVADVETVKLIVMATICLHNYLKQSDDKERTSNALYCPPGFLDYEDVETGRTFHGTWRQGTSQQGAIRDIKTLGKRNYTRMSEMVRGAFKEYFCSDAGKTSWQVAVVTRGGEGI